MALNEQISAALADSHPEHAARMTEILSGMRSGLLDPFAYAHFLSTDRGTATSVLDALDAAGIVVRGVYGQHGHRGEWCNNHFDFVECQEALATDGVYECSLCCEEIDQDTPVRQVVQYEYRKQ